MESVQQQQTTTALEKLPTVKSHIVEDSPGYARLNPKCKPERIGVVHQLEEVLNTMRQMDGNTPPYVRQKVGAMLADLDSGDICMYSEQMDVVISPGYQMAMGDKEFYVYLQTLNPQSPGYRLNILFSVTHERLHYEDNLPNTLENFVNGEIAVRKRVCDNGILPLQGIQKGYIPRMEECEWYRRDPKDWEDSISKEYTQHWLPLPFGFFFRRFHAENPSWPEFKIFNCKL